MSITFLYFDVTDSILKFLSLADVGSLASTCNHYKLLCENYELFRTPHGCCNGPLHRKLFSKIISYIYEKKEIKHLSNLTPKLKFCTNLCSKFCPVVELVEVSKRIEDLTGIKISLHLPTKNSLSLARKAGAKNCLMSESFKELEELGIADNNVVVSLFSYIGHECFNISFDRSAILSKSAHWGIGRIQHELLTSDSEKITLVCALEILKELDFGRKNVRKILPENVKFGDSGDLLLVLLPNNMGISEDYYLKSMISSVAENYKKTIICCSRN